ncbi:hypothetical protein BDK51DRAFT_33074 [Blyttiomyces helicus]|uniref:Uncharacterized protein n=1 Tax=Blyttiomyces helicus TaxID=388810 RepID=A0A4P9WIW7_9FUNG|nr:hypothetical protein BDK51DRAFT_33074 [Blyttiomyces helicus]|eukprot:RKO92841.1 hypothetical protein BDK51DRAFT_33074 [Blyttiomyces helicus]
MSRSPSLMSSHPISFVSALISSSNAGVNRIKVWWALVMRIIPSTQANDPLNGAALETVLSSLEILVALVVSGLHVHQRGKVAMELVLFAKLQRDIGGGGDGRVIDINPKRSSPSLWWSLVLQYLHALRNGGGTKLGGTRRTLSQAMKNFVVWAVHRHMPLEIFEQIVVKGNHPQFGGVFALALLQI